MKKTTLFFALFLSITYLFSQENQVNTTPTPNYRLAAKFSPTNLAKLVHSTSVTPNWLKNGNRFWYQYKTTNGSKYYLVDADKKTKTELFDNAKMAKWLTEITKDPYDAQHLPKFNFEFVNNETAIRFRITSNEEIEAVDDKNQDKQKDSTSTKKRKKENSKNGEKRILF